METVLHTCLRSMVGLSSWAVSLRGNPTELVGVVAKQIEYPEGFDFCPIVLPRQADSTISDAMVLGSDSCRFVVSLRLAVYRRRG